MVATRRQAPAGLEDELAMDQNPELILQKKPVRKAATKATKKTETKPATTRGKKTAQAAEVEENEAVEETKPKTTRGKKAIVEAPKPAAKKAAGRPKKDAAESVPEETVPAAKATRATKTGSVRGKKAIAVNEDEPEVEAVAEAKPARSTKAGSVRGRKAVAAAEEAPIAEEAKTTRANKTGSVRGRKPAAAAEPLSLAAPEEAKPARQTRGAAPKAQPLSPKKITQVSKAPARNTKNVTQKPAAKVTQAKAPAKNTRTTRKRGVSDENADVLELETTRQDEEDVEMLSATPVKKAPTRTRAAKQEAAAESEASMSSAPTTPNDSTAHTLEQVDEEIDEPEDNQSEAHEEDANEDSGASDDELCGPKTPMKRSSPGAEARYRSSVQRTIRKYEDEIRMETPARRFAVLGTQKGTPQTENPYRKPTAPSSGVRPMTVARGSGRALVFKDLREGAPTMEQAEFDQDEASFIPDEDIIPEMSNSPMIEPTEAPSPSNLNLGTELGNSEDRLADYETDEEDYVDPSAVQKYSDDPDDTVIIQEAEEEMASEHADPAQSFETEDTVIINLPDQDDADAKMLDDVAESEQNSVIMYSPPHKSTKGPEIAQEATITVNFDLHMSDVRVPSLENETAHLSLAQSEPPSFDAEVDTVAGAEMEMDVDEPLAEDVERRQTVNFNEFIDMAALVEPTRAFSVPEESVQPSSVELTMGDSAADPSLVEDVSERPTAAAQIHDEDGVEKVNEPQIPHYALPTLAFDARRKSLPAFSHRTPVKVGSRPNTSDGSSVPRIANPFANPWWARSRAGSTAATPVKGRPSTSHATPTAISFGTPAKKAKTPNAATSTPVATPKERYPFLAARQTYDEHSKTIAAPVRFSTPAAKSPKRRETFHKAAPGQTIAKAAESVASTPIATPKERYPALGSRQDYQDHAKTVAAPVRFATPTAKSPKRRETFHKAASGQIIEKAPEPTVSTPIATPKERYPARGTRQDYNEHANTVAAPVRFSTPTAKSPKRRETFHKGASGQVATTKETEPNAAATPTAVATPQAQATPGDRYPRLRPRQDYEDHAKTVGGPVRFQTPPSRTPAKRPATAMKGDNLRKAALTANTPMKTPLKGPGMTPGQEPLTPHPAAPLRGVLAIVEVFTLEGASASAPFVALLHRLGAKTTRAWNDRITHVIFKDGSPTTLQRVRLHNKDVNEDGNGALIHCVNSRWVTDCDTEGARMDEAADDYAVDIADVPRGGKRRRKSMEPAALMNLGGNVVRDPSRKSSLGRSSGSLRQVSSEINDSPAKQATASPVDVEMMDKENSATPPQQQREFDGSESPATPAWIAAPGDLVQQTAPMNRVRKLELPGGKQKEKRRLTGWGAGSMM